MLVMDASLHHNEMAFMNDYGFGYHFAKILAGAGATVVVAARRVDRLDALAAELTAEGHSVYGAARQSEPPPR
jgi:NAD(P)-dependent dehydrogenase (short-subunit alcohol dehydrogenase family)